MVHAEQQNSRMYHRVQGRLSVKVALEMSTDKDSGILVSTDHIDHLVFSFAQLVLVYGVEVAFILFIQPNERGLCFVPLVL